MRLVAVLRVGRGNVNVPSPVDGVKFWCPDVGGVVCVWWWTPLYRVSVVIILEIEVVGTYHTTVLLHVSPS